MYTVLTTFFRLKPQEQNWIASVLSRWTSLLSPFWASSSNQRPPDRSPWVRHRFTQGCEVKLFFCPDAILFVTTTTIIFVFIILIWSRSVRWLPLALYGRIWGYDSPTQSSFDWVTNRIMILVIVIFIIIFPAGVFNNEHIQLLSSLVSKERNHGVPASTECKGGGVETMSNLLLRNVIFEVSMRLSETKIAESLRIRASATISRIDNRPRFLIDIILEVNHRSLHVWVV